MIDTHAFRLHGRFEGLTVHARAFDVTLRDAVERAIAEIEATLGPIAVLVHNAGMTRRAPSHELTEALVNDARFSESLINRTPSRRRGDVEELTGAAVFLASDASRFVNGHILYVDGGVTASL